MNKLSNYIWVKKVIESCTTLDHVRTTRRLIWIFDRMHHDILLLENLLLTLRLKIYKIENNNLRTKTDPAAS
jgi:hypothetical protein